MYTERNYSFDPYHTEDYKDVSPKRYYFTIGGSKDTPIEHTPSTFRITNTSLSNNSVETNIKNTGKKYDHQTFFCESNSKDTSKPLREQLFSVEYIENESQLKELAACFHSILPMSYPENVYKYILKSNAEKYSFLLRNADGEMIGGMGCRLERDPANENTLKLYCMFLAIYDEYRRFGLGKLMIEQAIHNAMKFNDDELTISTFYLHVQVTNDVAIKFYEACGFQKGALIENYYKRISPSAAYLMSYKINKEHSNRTCLIH